jgi:hypothetical protein
MLFLPSGATGNYLALLLNLVPESQHRNDISGFRPLIFFTKTTGEDQGEWLGLMTPLSNII